MIRPYQRHGYATTIMIVATKNKVFSHCNFSSFTHPKCYRFSNNLDSDSDNMGVVAGTFLGLILLTRHIRYKLLCLMVKFQILTFPVRLLRCLIFIPIMVGDTSLEFFYSAVAFIYAY
jgi:hypothetical protein